MIPTGGVNLETAGDFLKAGACAVAVGGELVDAKTIKEGRYDVIESAPGSTSPPSPRHAPRWPRRRRKGFSRQAAKNAKKTRQFFFLAFLAAWREEIFTAFAEMRFRASSPPIPRGVNGQRRAL